MVGRHDGRRVLVVDDEPSIVDAVATALRYEGFEVFEARTGRIGLATAQTEALDLIVLDVMLPDVDGFEVARRLRADGVSTPILFLTARDALDDKVQGFGARADDYVTKPFSLAEIVLRANAIVQRASGVAKGETSRLSFADVVMDQDTHEVRRCGALVELTATEFKLLRFLRSIHAGCCPSRRSSTTCGTTTSTAIRTSSRPTSATCAASSTRLAHR